MSYTESVSAGNTDDIVTVPAGTTFYVTGISLYSNSASNQLCSIKIGAVDVLRAYLGAQGNAQEQGAPILVVEAGETLKCYSQQGAYVNVWGFTQT